MGLVFRINLMITALLVVLLGIALFQVVERVRVAVLDEVSTATEESLQLISLVVADETISDAAKRKLIVGLSSLADTEQVSVDHRTPSDQFVFRAHAMQSGAERAAPDWFMRLMLPTSSPQFAHAIPQSRQGRVQVLINPADRIDKSWREISPLLYFLAGFAILSYSLVYLCVRLALRPVGRILTGLDQLADGDYTARLPVAGLPELRSVSRRINVLAGELQRAEVVENRLRLAAIGAQEQERRHLARELHDEFGQSLTAIKALSVAEQSSSGHQALGDRLSIVRLCDHLHDVLRGLMRRLRPAVLDEFGLTSALQHMVDDWNEIDENVFCSLSIQGDLGDCDDAVSLAIYRMIQECLTNTHKYASASEVAVVINRQASQIEMRYCDNGVGYRIDSATDGYGLRGLRERARALDGSLTLTSSPGHGFELVCILPLKRPPANAEDALRGGPSTVAMGAQ